MKEQCLVIIKPDGMVKHIVGDIITKVSETQLSLIGAKIIEVTREIAEEHYQHLKEEKFFADVIKYITGEYHTKNVLALVYSGEDACAKIRESAGATNPEEAHPTSIRGKYGRITTHGVFENVIHASENGAEAEREIKLWFRPEELVEDVYETETGEVTIMKKTWK